MCRIGLTAVKNIATEITWPRGSAGYSERCLSWTCWPRLYRFVLEDMAQKKHNELRRWQDKNERSSACVTSFLGLYVGANHHGNHVVRANRPESNPVISNAITF